MLQISLKSDPELKRLLISYLRSAELIKRHIQQNGLARFSHKKFVADLGEYYFYIHCKHLFLPDSLKQSSKATAPYDFEGVFITDNVFKKYSNRAILIEVKTRYAQDKDPYLLGIKSDKFNVLVFVFLDYDYGCKYIGLIDRDNLKGKISGKQNRLVFKDDGIEKIMASGKFEKIIPIKNKGVKNE